MTANASPAALAPVDVDKVLKVLDEQMAGCGMLHPESCPDCADMREARAAVEQMAADLAAARDERAELHAALGKLANYLGNPALEVHPFATVAGALVDVACQRLTAAEADAATQAKWSRAWRNRFVSERDGHSYEMARAMAAASAPSPLVASLRACIELAAKASPGPWTTGDGDPESILSERDYTCIAQANTSFVDRAPANAAAIAAAVNFIRDDAPALLAEVADLREKLQATQEQADRFHARAESYRKDAEAAEQVAREAVALLERASPEVLDLANLLHSDYGRIKQADSDRAEALAREIDTFTAHHGAGTGESNG